MDSREPGRELDRLVAEKVFGWTEWAWTIGGDCHLRNWFREKPERLFNAKYNGRTPDGTEEPSGEPPFPEYSTSLAAAEEVIKRYESGCHWQIKTPYEDGMAYRAGFSPKGTPHRAGTPVWSAESAISIAHAVCLTAIAFEEEKRG